MFYRHRRRFYQPLSPLQSAPNHPACLHVQSVGCMTASELDDLSLQEKNILIYIGGYIVRKLSAKACESCSTLISSEISPPDPDHTFLRTKNFAKVKVGLQAPTSLLVSTLQQMEKVYLNQVDSVLYGSGVRAALVSLLLECVDPKQCDRCKLQSHIVGSMVNIWLHHTIRQANTTLRDKKDRKNRKTLKFSHLKL